MKWLIIILCFVFVAFQKSPTPYSGEKEKDWVLFIKEFKGDKFLVRFPIDPLVSYMQEDTRIYSEKDGARYLLILGQRKGVEKDQLLENELINILENEKVEMVSYKLGSEMLDMEYKSKEKNGGIWKARIVVQKDVVYRFFTWKKMGENDQHEYFIGSFEVDK